MVANNQLRSDSNGESAKKKKCTTCGKRVSRRRSTASNRAKYKTISKKEN